MLSTSFAIYLYCIEKFLLAICYLAAKNTLGASSYTFLSFLMEIKGKAKEPSGNINLTLPSTSFHLLFVHLNMHGTSPRDESFEITDEGERYFTQIYLNWLKNKQEWINGTTYNWSKFKFDATESTFTRPTTTIFLEYTNKYFGTD